MMKTFFCPRTGKVLNIFIAHWHARIGVIHPLYFSGPLERHCATRKIMAKIKGNPRPKTLGSGAAHLFYFVNTVYIVHSHWTLQTTIMHYGSKALILDQNYVI